MSSDCFQIKKYAVSAAVFSWFHMVTRSFANNPCPVERECSDRRSVIGPVRWFEIPDRHVLVRYSGLTKLVRIFGPKFRSEIGPELIIWSISSSAL